MPDQPSHRPDPTILLVGASRGLGLALSAEFLRRNWTVIATVRTGAGTGLDDLVHSHAGRLEIERLDINDPAAIAGLRNRLAGRQLDMVFVNAGTTTADQHVSPGTVSTDEFTRVMVTNALSPMRVIEALQDLVPDDGLIGAMSSGQGSITNNEAGMRDIYRASKAALNMLMRSFAARQSGSSRALVLLAPGWIRTDLGGPEAPFSLEESVPILVDLLVGRRGTPGLAYLDRFGRTVPW